ncbi:MAG: monovalent cation/H+ antiporter complex subunit F [Defluviitaleaceae bacterium]|nr:monovalent cation/H+ antiporter complex subunit F [Defluviitaleaceae bacterium]
MYVVLAIMLGLLVPYGIRVMLGPSVWDRLLGMNLIASKIIVIIIIFSSVNEMTFLLDFAIIYALSGFIGTIFIALFLSERNRKKDKGGKENGNS